MPKCTQKCQQKFFLALRIAYYCLYLVVSLLSNQSMDGRISFYLETPTRNEFTRQRQFENGFDRTEYVEIKGFIQMHLTKLTQKQLPSILTEKADMLNAFP